jgi:hypothetical protein
MLGVRSCRESVERLACSSIGKQLRTSIPATASVERVVSVCERIQSRTDHSLQPQIRWVTVSRPRGNGFITGLGCTRALAVEHFLDAIFCSHSVYCSPCFYVHAIVAGTAEIPGCLKEPGPIHSVHRDCNFVLLCIECPDRELESVRDTS